MYSLKDLKKAEDEHERIAKLWSDAYSKDKPNEYDFEAREATKRLQTIEQYLKASGVLAFSEHELIEETLNHKYPHAQSRDVVRYQGKRYQKQFIPLELSKTGKTVKKWGSKWIDLENNF